MEYQYHVKLVHRQLVMHNVIVSYYLPPPVISCLVMLYLPDGVISITCISLF